MAGGEAMTGEKFLIVGGPWPERIGRTAYVVPDPGDGVYPFDKPDADHVVIFIPADPLVVVGRSWTCCIRRSDLARPS